MTEATLKANDNKYAYDVTLFSLPMPSLQDRDATDMEIYARFMKHMRLVPSSVMDIKILSAIQFTSDMLDMNDAVVAKTLVNMGLRAPRRAFPESYLDYVDRAMTHMGWNVGAPCAGTIAINDHWNSIGEESLTGIRGHYSPPVEIIRV